MTDNIEITKPDDYLNIQVNKADHEVFMSGGLIRILVALVGDDFTQDSSIVFRDPKIQNNLIVECLRPRHKRGQPKETNEPYTIEDFVTTQEDSSTLLNWITEHILHFFMSSLTSIKTLSDKTQPMMKKMEDLAQSLTGTQTSVAETPSAGLTEPSQVS